MGICLSMFEFCAGKDKNKYESINIVDSSDSFESYPDPRIIYDDPQQFYSRYAE